MRVQINFVSRERAATTRLYVALAVSGAALAVLFSVLYGSYQGLARERAGLVRQAVEKSSELAKVESRLAELKKTVSPKEVKEVSDQAAFANDAIKRRVFSWDLFLNRLEDVVPAGVELTSIRPNFSTLEVDISGKALDIGRLTEFVERLTKSPYFDDFPPMFHTNETLVDKDIGKTLQFFNLKTSYYPDGRENMRESNLPVFEGTTGTIAEGR